MECVNPNTPEFKKVLEDVGGNPLLAEIEMNNKFLDKIDLLDLTSSEKERLQRTVEYSLINTNSEEFSRKGGQHYVFLSDRDAQRFSNLIDINKGFPREFKVTKNITKYDRDIKNPLKFHPYNEYVDYYYIKSNKNKKSNLYNIINKETGEIIFSKVRVLSVSKDSKSEIAKKYGLEYTPTKVFSANRSIAFALYRQKPSKAKYIAQAKQYLYDAIKFLNPEETNLKINLDKIEELLSSFPEEMWDYINTTYSPEDSTNVNASISLQNEIKFKLPKLGFLQEIEKITGIKLQGVSFKNYDRSNSLSKIFKYSKLDGNWGDTITIDSSNMTTRELKASIRYYLSTKNIFKPSSEEENVRKYAEHNGIDYNELKELVFGDFDNALGNISYNHTGNSDTIELSKWRQSIRNYDWQSAELFNKPYENFQNTVKERITEKFKDKNLSNGISHLEYFFNSGAFNWLNINLNNISGQYYIADMETEANVGVETKMGGIVNPFEMKVYQKPKAGENFLQEKEVFNRLAAILHEPFHALHALSYGSKEELELRKAFDNLYKTDFGKEMMDQVFGLGYNQNQQISYDTLYKEFTAFTTQLMLYPKEWVNKTDLRSNDIAEFILKIQTLQDKTYEEILKTQQKVGTIEKTIIEEEKIKLTFLEKLYNYLVKALNKIIPLSKKFTNLIADSKLVEKQVIEDVFGTVEETVTKTLKLPEDVKKSKQEFLQAMDELQSAINTLMEIDSKLFSSENINNFFTEKEDIFYQRQENLHPVQRDAKKLFFDEIYRKNLTSNDRQRINGILKRMSDSVGDTTWFLRMNNDKTGYYIAGYRNAPVTMESYYSPYVGILSEKRGLQKIGDTESSVASPETIKMIKDLLKRIGVDISSLQKIVVNGRKSDANGAALIMQKLIQVVEGKEAGTLPEEAMHFVVEIVKQVNPKLYKKLLSEINQYALLKQVFIDYGTDPDYQTKDGKPDVIKLKEEAIAKVLVETIINNAEGITEKPELLNKVRQSWWQSIIEFFKNLFSKSGFDRLSMDIITGKFTGTADDIKSERDITFLQKSKQEIAYDLLKEKASNIELRQRTDGTKDFDYFLRDTGKKIKNRVTNIVKDWYDNLFRNSKLLDTEFQKAVYDLKADTGTIGHSVMEYAFHLFVDEDGYLRDTPLEDSDYESKFTDDAGNIIFDRNKYEILKNNLKQRLESLDKDRTAGRTRFMAEIIIYDPNRDMAGTIDLIAISPKGKINMYDWKFMDIDTDKYSDVPWYKIKAWDKQMSQYKYILEKMYGMKSEDFQHTRMIPIQAVYSKPVYKKGQEKLPKLLSIKIGDVDIKNISDDYLLPVATKGERTGVEEIDALIDKLNMIYDTISERKITNEDEKKQKAQELNELFSAIRQLQIKQNVAPLINQAKLLNMMIENTITEYNTKYKDDDVDINSFSEDEIDNFEREIDESLEALYAYTDLDTDLRELFDLNKKEDKELYEGIKEVSNEARRLESRLKKIRKSYVADVVVKREGIDEHLKGEKVVKGISKWFVTTTGIQTKAVQWLFRKASRALSFAAFDTQSESARLEKLRKEYIEWAKAKGLAIKDYFKILKKPDKNELINEFDNKFYKELEQKIAEKDFTWIRDNIDKVAYRDHLKELLEKELKRIEEKPRVSDDPDADILLEKQKARRLYTLSNTEAVGWLIYDQVKKFPRRDKWESKEWKELNKPENKPAKDFYNYILERNSEYKKLGYINNPRTFLPYVRKSLIDKFVTGGDITFGEHFFRSISIDEGDVGYGQIDANGRPINVIPKYFTREVDGEMSEDLFRTMAMYNEAAIRYKYFAQIENQIKGVLNVERNKQSIATSFFGKPKLKDGKIEYVEGNDDNSKILENLIKSIVYGQKYIESETFDQLLFKLGTWGETLNKKLGIKVFPEGLAERQVSMSKSIDTLNNIFQLNALGLNILSATSNLFGGTAQAVINAGTYFTKADYLSSELTMFLNKFNGTDKKKMIGALNYFLPLTENYNRQIAKKLSLSTLTQESLQDFLMVLMRQSDLNVQTTIFYAFLKNTIVINGELLNAREYLRSKPEYEEKYKGTREQRIAYEEEFENEVEKLIEEKGIMKVAQIVDGEFTIPGIDRKSKGVVDLRVKVRQLSGDALGNLTEENIRLINASVYGKSFMVFKNWIPRPVDVRVSSLKYNAAMDAYEWGRMRTIMRIIGEDLLNKTDYLYASLIGSEKGVDFMRQLYEKKKAEYAAETGKTLKMTEAQFIDLVRTNIRNQIYDVMFLTSMFLIVVGLKAAMPDDDGEDEAVMNQYRFIVKMADKFRTELSYFYDPTNLISLVSFPSLSFVENFRKAIKNFLKENWALATGDTETAEDTYVIKYWMKTFPFTNQLAQYMPMFYPELAKDLGIRMQSNYSLIRK